MDKNDSILLEDVNHKLDAVLEGQQAMAHVPAKLDAIDIRLQNVESDVKTIKLVVTGHSSTLDNPEERITQLEGVSP